MLLNWESFAAARAQRIINAFSFLVGELVLVSAFSCFSLDMIRRQ